MSTALEAHGGVIDKYIGDAIMALFGAPVAHGDDADRALAAALAMQRALVAFNAELAAEGKPPLGIGIGINTARVVAGNIGSARRLNYSVIGDGVNVAARIRISDAEHRVSHLDHHHRRHPRRPPPRRPDRARTQLRFPRPVHRPRRPDPHPPPRHRPRQRPRRTRRNLRRRKLVYPNNETPPDRVDFSALSFALCRAAPGDPLTLWYDQPSERWTDALPVGNGRLAAMVYGGPIREQLQLNEDTLTSGEPPADLRSLDITKDFDHVTGLIKAGKNTEADTYVTKNWLGRNQQCYQPLGDLWLDFAGTGPVTAYRRWLDLTTATAGVELPTRRRHLHPRDPCQRPRRRSSPSACAPTNPARSPSKLRSPPSTPPPNPPPPPANSFSAAKSPVSSAAASSRPSSNGATNANTPSCYNADGTRKPHAAQVLYGADIDGKGTFFEARLTIRTDGKVIADADTLRVEGATEATVFVTAASSFNGPDKSPSREGLDPSLRTTHDLREAAARSYTTLRERHLADYTALFNRVSLRLDGDPAKDRLPTDARIPAFRVTGDPALAALPLSLRPLPHDCRLSRRHPSPRPSGQVERRCVVPPWASSYTVNINAEMNYSGRRDHQSLRAPRTALPPHPRDRRQRRPHRPRHVSPPWLGCPPQHLTSGATASPSTAAPPPPSGTWPPAGSPPTTGNTGSSPATANSSPTKPTRSLRAPPSSTPTGSSPMNTGKLVTPVSTSPENTFVAPDGKAAPP